MVRSTTGKAGGYVTFPRAAMRPEKIATFMDSYGMLQMASWKNSRMENQK
ncbi:MAG: hypothetical protein M0Z50_05265 [Planctomycetia bacterium]|jgi:hypothetical protein|nr:hypothetical protein [Planctomycetia bacterium]